MSRHFDSEFFQRNYGLDLSVGRIGKYLGDGHPRSFRITGQSGPHVRVKFDDDGTNGILHPTWKVEWTTPGQVLDVTGQKQSLAPGGGGA